MITNTQKKNVDINSLNSSLRSESKVIQDQLTHKIRFMFINIQTMYVQMIKILN